MQFKNQKSKFVFTSLLFLVLQFAILLPGFGNINNPVQEMLSEDVCAQSDGPKILGGVACVRSEKKCPDGFGKFGSPNVKLTGLKEGDFSTSFKDTFGGSVSVNEICVNTLLGNIFVVKIPIGDLNNGGGGNLKVFKEQEITPFLDRDNNIIYFPQACRSDWFVVDGKDQGILGGNDSGVYGCCPGSSDTFALQAESNGKFDGNRPRFGCCPSGYDFIDSSGSCTDLSNNKTSAIIPPKEYKDGKNQQYGVVLGSSVSYQSNWDPTTTPNPSTAFVAGFTTESDSVCQISNGCAVVNTAKGISSGSGTILQGNDGSPSNYQIINSQELVDNKGFECTRCMNNGEAIAVQGDNLLVCSGAGTVTSSPLINGNVNDTLAYLAADPDNREILKSCRERGGIYIALGCIDPTPVGVITGLIRIAFGVIGGVALIQLILAGIAYQSGEEERIQAARSKVFATISGLVVLVFSVLILRIIGVNVLDIIPGGAI